MSRMEILGGMFRDPQSELAILSHVNFAADSNTKNDVEIYGAALHRNAHKSI